jgi:GNAT superfamily N-acetyltransferase
MTVKSQEEYIAKFTEEHLIKHWMIFKSTQGSKSIDSDYFKHVSANPYNRVLYANQLEIEESELKKLLHNEGEPLLWIIGPSTKLSDTDKSFLEENFNLYQEWTGMGLSVNRTKSKNEKRLGFDIKRVNSETELKEWIDVYVEGYQKPIAYKSALYNRYKQIMNSDQDHYHLYIGYFNNKPAVVGSLFMNDGIAGLYCITTAHNMRRKGLATNYLKSILQIASQQGASDCILHATEAGKHIYEKVGFITNSSFQVYAFIGK